ncbi:hypothetical protein [Polaromonas sp.]|uniref:hypothetical protein n=1 Tax=Polaromonas sp. TaxID=1869339 RepID=UPI003CA48C62
MKLFGKAATGFFASQSLAGHLLRGATAFVLLYWAVVHQQAQPFMALLAGAGALIAMRGCPVCWTLGLVETIGQKLKRQSG